VVIKIDNVEPFWILQKGVQIRKLFDGIDAEEFQIEEIGLQVCLIRTAQFHFVFFKTGALKVTVVVEPFRYDFVK